MSEWKKEAAWCVAMLLGVTACTISWALGPLEFNVDLLGIVVFADHTQRHSTAVFDAFRTMGDYSKNSLCIMRVLAEHCATGAVISGRNIRKKCGGIVSPSSLYISLSRLEDLGHIESMIGPDGGERLFSPTEKGIAELAALDTHND